MAGDRQSAGDPGNGSRNSGDGQQDGNSGPSTAEKVVMIISVAFTVALFAFVLWQALTTPSGVDPTAAVVDTQPMAGGDVRATVRFTNPGDIGVEMAIVEVDCTTPPTEVEFQHVPADDYQEAEVACPAGTTDANASVSWWIEA